MQKKGLEVRLTTKQVRRLRSLPLCTPIDTGATDVVVQNVASLGLISLGDFTSSYLGHVRKVRIQSGNGTNTNTRTYT